MSLIPLLLKYYVYVDNDFNYCNVLTDPAQYNPNKHTKGDNLCSYVT